MPKLTFHSQNHNSFKDKSILVEPKSNLMASINKTGVPLGSSCGGEGICAKCVVKVVENPEGLSKPNATEKKVMEREKLAPFVRVACQCKVVGDVTITTDYW